MEKSPIRAELLDILACPACDDKPKVELTGDYIHCPKCDRLYPIENGIPVMLIEKAIVKGESKGD